jgi:hypothetical protein
MVEFALAMPVALLLILGIMEMGWLFFSYSSLFTADHAAGRYAAAVGTSASGVPYYKDLGGICGEAQRFAGLAGLSPTVTIYYDGGPETPESTKYDCNSTSTYQANLGSRVHVELRATYHPLEPFANLPDIPLVSHTVRTIITGVSIE